jgi:hypothetical protein
MSTNEQEHQIEDLLKKLDGRSKVKTLRQSHNSILISFKQMLAYIEKIKIPDKQRDIELLLRTYRKMAQKFYTQYELSLLKEIKKQRDARKQSQLAIKKIEGLKDKDKKSLETAKHLLAEAAREANDEHKALIKNFPILLQNALDKLRDEWERVGAIAVASRALSQDDKLTRSLELAVAMVAYSVGIEEERIVIVPGTTFALHFFKYLDNFAVLTVPIYSVQAPWEWSIFWHELAGYQVRQVEKGTIIEIIRTKKLPYFHEIYTATKDENQKEALLDMITRNNKFGRKYLKDLFGVNELDLSDLGGFDHQFERILTKLPENNKIQIYEKMKIDGWCVDWFKELFEDAYSVLAIGVDCPEFLRLFEDILTRHGVRDDHHPPLDIRRKVAHALLNPKDIKNPGTLEEIEETIIEITAQQILKFMPLINSALPQFENALSAQQEFQKRNNSASDYLRETQEDLFKSVEATIHKSIKGWVQAINNQDHPIDIAKRNAKKNIEEFSKNLSVFAQLVKEKKGVPSYEKWLEDQDYKQLLAFSFYDIDFLTSSTPIEFWHSTTKYITTGVNLASAVARGFLQRSQLLADAFGLSIGGSTYWTTQTNFNALKAEVSIWIG